MKEIIRSQYPSAPFVRRPTAPNVPVAPYLRFGKSLRRRLLHVSRCAPNCRNVKNEEPEMQPQIEYSHVLGELSTNRNDPCEVIRELISNSYDAKAKNVHYAPIQDRAGILFLDDGSGLSPTKKKNDITPWEAFFSIGKSTKKQGEVIGYKCQGSKLCFACTRIMIATKDEAKDGFWLFIIIDNPRSNLNVNYDITPKSTNDIGKSLRGFYGASSASATNTIDAFLNVIKSSVSKTATLVVVDHLETENFAKYFATSEDLNSSYIYNYIRFSSCHGDIRYITKAQGFVPAQIQQLNAKMFKSDLFVFDGNLFRNVEFGFPYLAASVDPTIKSPASISRLRDGRFSSRSAKAFAVAQSKFSIVMAIDGNKRTHDDYLALDRRGATRSGIRLADQRGAFVSVKGIKICKYFDIFLNIPGFEILAQGDSYTNFIMIIDGDFDLVTNRNSLSKKAFDTLCGPEFIAEVRKFLVTMQKNDMIFAELISRLKRESNESALSEQIDILDRSKARLKKRERFSVKDRSGTLQLHLSPLPGEEYLVGVLYATLGSIVEESNPFYAYWQKIITFSTQGIDSLALIDPKATAPLADKNIAAIEYKYEFENNGPFNHSLAIVDKIVAWEVQISTDKNVRDNFTCAGDIAKLDENNFEWAISNIETDEGAKYSQIISVVCLRALIQSTFPEVSYRRNES